ncbi:DUF3515 domain-containing protein [Corynebacterium atypicum]|uniref:DUF3515 domain-containing protein n=1 Tax=Corynebacterium atypicum TaxID=191610 RepID=UPI00118485F7|nr:DUF3515 domain-containing protein [Corynebacterium atypicum]
MGDRDQFSRTPFYAALVMAVVLVVGVLIGARVVFERAGNKPVVVSELPAPQADSAECHGLMDTLPANVAGYQRADIAEPAPESTAAWVKNSEERITLRCGVEAPAQWVEGAETEVVGGVSWLPVSDPEVHLTTWYSVNRTPVVAVTATDVNPTEDLAEAVRSLPEGNVATNALPLAATPTPQAVGCRDFLTHLPVAMGDYRLTKKEGPKAWWQAKGQMPVGVACGVDMPASYAPGERLTDINGVNWFTENGVFYALGFDRVVAVAAAPQGAEEVLVPIGAALKQAR